MLAKNNIAVMAVLVGVLFIAAFAAQAYDYGEVTHATLFYTGKITGIDPAYKMLTIKAGPNDESYFRVLDNASLRVCDSGVSFRDLKIGEDVTVTFFSESLGGDKLVTDLKDIMKC